MPRRLGQHFLANPSILDRIAREACPEPEPLVIEIGPGRGALTRHLLQRAARVVAIELDRNLAAYLREKFPEKLTVVEADVLRVDLAQWGPAAIAGNLPYYITSPILEHVLAAGDAFHRGVFLMQKEVAERVTAAPGGREYGYLSAHLSLLAETEYLFEVAPGAFKPPPKVDSAVIRCRYRDRSAELGIADQGGFVRFLKACFRQKRKTLRNNLAGLYSRERVDGLPQAGLRAEQLRLEEFAEIWRSLQVPG